MVWRALCLILMQCLGITLRCNSMTVSSSSRYNVVRNANITSLLIPYDTKASDIASQCISLCTLDLECMSVLYNGDRSRCMMFNDTQTIYQTSQRTDTFYAEKINCNPIGWSEIVYPMCSGYGAEQKVYIDCQDAFESGERDSGDYYIRPDRTWRVFRAVCQFDSTSGWTLVQRRLDGSVDFYRYWDDYVEGFGELNGEYWLGLDAIYYLTLTNQKLSVYLEDHDGEVRTANYSQFYIESADTDYISHVGEYSGTAGNSWDTSYHHLAPFSTRDRDNDNWGGSCAQTFTGGWWYGGCHTANLNGQWYEGGDYTEFATGTSWHSWRGHYYSYKTIYIRVGR